MIEAVTIDFWNTLVNSGNGAPRKAAREAALRRVFEGHGRPFDIARAEQALRTAYAAFEEVWQNEQRTLDADACLRIVWQELDLQPEPDEHRNTIVDFEDSILAGMPELLPGVSEALRLLSEHYRLGIISDTAYSPGSRLRDVLHAHGILERFSCMVFSDEAGASKPSPAVFSAALQGLDARPETAVHIGDIERTDIVGAKNAGMRAILYRGDETARYRDESDGKETRADAVVEDWSEIPGILQRWSSL